MTGQAEAGDLDAARVAPPTEAHENTIDLHEHITRRHNQVGTLRTFADKTETWEDTRAIEQAARAAFIKNPDVDQLVLEARLEWMAGSGAAHGLVRPLFGTAGTRVLGPVDKHGRAVIQADGSYARVLDAYLLAYWMTTAGWKLLRRRGL